MLLLFLVVEGTVSENEKKEHDCDGHNVDNIDSVLLHHNLYPCMKMTQSESSIVSSERCARWRREEGVMTCSYIERQVV